MNKRNLLLPVILLFLASSACNLTSIVGSTATPALFPSSTAASTQAVLPPTTEVVPGETSPASSSTALPPEPSATSAAPQAKTSPTAPPTVIPKPVKPTATRPAPTSNSSGTMQVKIGLIALSDNGASGHKIGCGDSVVTVNVQVARTQGVLRAALDKLLSLKNREYGMSGLYNALYQSDLEISSVSIVNGEAIIKLAGSLASGGVCDDPRIIAQIEETALQFSTVKTVSIYVNGKKIQDLLSGRGG